MGHAHLSRSHVCDMGSFFKHHPISVSGDIGVQRRAYPGRVKSISQKDSVDGAGCPTGSRPWAGQSGWHRIISWNFTSILAILKRIAGRPGSSLMQIITSQAMTLSDVMCYYTTKSYKHHSSHAVGVSTASSYFYVANYRSCPPIH